MKEKCDGSIPRPVRNKLDFVPRYKAGEFGNHSPSWDTVEELVASNYFGPVHFRNRIAGGPTWYNVPSFCAKNWMENLVENGSLDPALIYLSAMAPHRFNVIQGEVRQDTEHLHVWYSTAPNLPMRDALEKEHLAAEGLRASLLLQEAMDPVSWDWLNYLLEAYPDHVVEFSTFSVGWGTLGWNTVFWECRLY